MTQRPPYVDPALSPAAAKLARGLPKVQAPLAGGAAPPIPLLTQDTRGMEEVPMAELARQQRPAPSAAATASILGAQAPSPAATPTAKFERLLPQDMLPSKAAEDPDFQGGANAMMAVTQPHLAFKYGIIRNGQFYPPGSDSPVRAGAIRPETQRLIAEAVAANREGVALPGEPPPYEPPPPSSDGQRAAEIGVRQGLRMDEFDFAAWRSRIENVFNNPEEQAAVARRCGKMSSIGQMIVNGFAEQEVHIIPGTDEDRLVVKYRTVRGADDLACKRLLGAESKGSDYSEAYLLERYGLMTLACALESVNGKPMPRYVNDNDKFDEEAFMKRFNKIIGLPLPLLACLGAHYFFFEVRLRNALSASNVKNG